MSIYVNIRKKVGSFQLDVQFEAGHETLALLGDSGCGKSMTLRCIAGVVTPDEGVIRINGETVFDSEHKINLKSQQRRVGYLFQNYALFPNMTVLQNIMAGMEREKGLSKARRREWAMEYVSRLRLDGLEDHYPSQLSGGQQQRAALARMLASRPALILLDEPFSALDATLRWEMEQVVRQTINGFDGTALLVTHNRDEVYRLSDKVAVYLDGKINRFGEKWEIFAAPVTATAARLSGCKNLSPAHWEGNRIVADDWGISFPAQRDDACVWLGIRAHRFELSDAPGEYAFAYELVESIEDTFSYIYQIRAKDVPAAKPMRWEVEKALHLKVPQTGFVRIPPEELLLLKA